MTFALTVILNLSILIAAIIGIIRFNKINKSFYPFLFFIWAGSVNELLSLFLMLQHIPSSVNNNLYVLLEALVLVYFFKRIQVLKLPSYFYSIIFCGLTGLWIIENIIAYRIEGVSFYFRITYSFVIVLFSISITNKLIGTHKNIFTSPLFLICTSFTVFFTYKILVEAFWLYGLNASPGFQLSVYTILVYINFFCNLIYALAILWMPRKQIFTMPS